MSKIAFFKIFVDDCTKRRGIVLLTFNKKEVRNPSGPTLVSRLPLSKSTKEGVRSGMVRDSEQYASRIGVVVEAVNMEEN